MRAISISAKTREREHLSLQKKEKPFQIHQKEPLMVYPLTHLDEKGRALMVDVGNKDKTHRIAVARGSVSMRPDTLNQIIKGGAAKGDVLAVARVAGIMAAKKTADLIPLCHPVPISFVSVG